MSDLATLSSAPREITLACGETVAVAPLKAREWGRLQQWIKDHVPSPLARAKAAADLVDDLSRDERNHLLASAAVKPWPPRPGSQAWIDAIAEADDQQACTVAFLAAVLRDADMAARLAPRLVGDDFRRLNLAAFGADEPESDGPKA